VTALNRRALLFPWIACALAALVALAAAACDRREPSRQTSPAATASAAATPAQSTAEAERTQPAKASAAHNLSEDEAMGGHTLARHVGKTDAELLDRLRREPQISSASSYTDRPTAESVVGSALASPTRSLDAWRRRTGRRPNFVLRYDAHRDIGRSIARGRSESVPCQRALVVLRWDDRRQRSFVLTSYPEADR
jgi:hypothetical protein